MNSVALVLTEHVGGLMLVGAAVAFYVTSRAASDALAQGGAAASPVRHALAQWGGIVAVCLAAVWLDQAEIAVGVIFSTSVAALSLHLGVAVASIPEARGAEHGFDVLGQRPTESAQSDDSFSPTTKASPSALALGETESSRAWAMVLPVAVLSLMAGFSGKLTLMHALLFAIQGLLVMLVWAGERPDRAKVTRRVSLSPGRRAQLALALALAVVGAVCAVYGAARMSQETKIMSTGLIAAAALGPLLVLPMIGSASLLASEGQARTATGASVVIVLLNLCLLLPVVIAGWHVRERFFPPPIPQAVAPSPSATTTRAVTRPAATEPAPGRTTEPAAAPSADAEVSGDDFALDEPAPVDDMPRVLAFPIAVWRIDTVLLILLGLMLLPVSLNLWDMRRTEGFLLIVIYACYLVATTVLGRRW